MFFIFTESFSACRQNVGVSATGCMNESNPMGYSCQP